MRLKAAGHHWNWFARKDPLWAVLTDPAKGGNRWQADEFFATGVHTVNDDLDRVLRHYPNLRFGSALDFGCGVGRLTQALATRFDRVTGVDISPVMLEEASRYNRCGPKVSYVLNKKPNLSQFANDHFDFVYSLITLQHLEPQYALAYVAEFVRVAAPGGAIFFQLPAQALGCSLSGPPTPVPASPPRQRRPFTLWPDTLLKRLYRDFRAWRARPKVTLSPIMEMHVAPRAEVERVLASSGATLLHTYRYDLAGPQFESYGYLAIKEARQ